MKALTFITARLLAFLLFLSLTDAITQLPLSALAAAMCSDPVGRIYETNNKGASKGKIICNNERLQLVQSSAVPSILVYCFASGQYKTFSNSLIVSSVPGCGSPRQVRVLRFCPTGNPDGMLCDLPKGGETQQTGLRLIRPYGRAVMSTPNVLSWSPIQNADRYLVQIEGKDVQWQQTVSQPSVQLPSGSEWKAGSAYRITIAAYSREGRLLSARETVVNRLTVEIAQAVSDKAERIQQFNSNNIDEATALDLTHLYLSYGLLSEAIRALDARVQAGSQDPIVYRVLGDVYLSAQSPRLAKSFYEKAIALAERKGRSSEIAAARSGLAVLQQIPLEYRRL